ncbi:MAG: hypothetical protein N3A54_01315 [Patescibacteria group bacterium]|nr:hypothetical protein [Patescibacteria group bacterium]
MKYFIFEQNNSFGVFDFEENTALYAVAEAEDVHSAIERLEKYTDVYFNGVAKNLDCPCCGDRWSAGYHYELSEDPKCLDSFADNLMVGEPHAKYVMFLSRHKDIHFFTSIKETKKFLAQYDPYQFGGYLL